MMGGDVKEAGKPEFYGKIDGRRVHIFIGFSGFAYLKCDCPDFWLEIWGIKW